MGIILPVFHNDFISTTQEALLDKHAFHAR